MTLSGFLRFVRWLAVLAWGALSLGAETVWRVGLSRQATYPTLHEALAALPAGNPERIVIELEAGLFQGPFVLKEPRVTLRGQGPATVLTGNLGQAMPGRDGQPIGWQGASTLYVAPAAVDTVIEYLTLENTYGKGMQAQACSVEADRVIFRLCRILGWQDTLRAEAGRQFYDRCYISGHVDFIYGGATAYFLNCELFVRDQGYIVAPSTPKGRTGYVFKDCRITAPYGDRPAYLGRPWRESPQAVFIDCEMGPCIRAEGWKEWRVPEAEVRFAEYGSKGPGGVGTGRVAWATFQPGPAPEEFSPKNVFVDWIP